MELVEPKVNVFDHLSFDTVSIPIYAKEALKAAGGGVIIFEHTLAYTPVLLEKMDSIKILRNSCNFTSEDEEDDYCDCCVQQGPRTVSQGRSWMGEAAPNWWGHIVIEFEKNPLHIVGVPQQESDGIFTQFFLVAKTVKIGRQFITHVANLRDKRQRDLIPDYVFTDKSEGKPRPTASWDDIVLAPGFRKQIEDNVSAFFQAKEAYKKARIDYKRGLLFIGPPGNGKCLGQDTPVLMFDGIVKKVQDIKTGDRLMGDDSTPRQVLTTTSGTDELYRVIPKKGDSYVVNKEHVLSLSWSGSSDRKVDIPISKYLASSKWNKDRWKGYRRGVNFSSRNVDLDPYILGYWLGDGTSNKPQITTSDKPIINYFRRYFSKHGLKVRHLVRYAYDITTGTHFGPRTRNFFLNCLRKYKLLNNKHIPHEYLCNDKKARLSTLAGLMDSDGTENCGGYDIVLKSELLADDVVFLSRSLGFAAYKKMCKKRCTNAPSEHEGTYFRICISGDLSNVPVLLRRKKCSARKQIKNVLHTGIKIVPVGRGKYFGFELDGNGRFLLGDFTVTHNSSVIKVLLSTFRKYACFLYGFTDNHGQLSELYSILDRASKFSPAIVILEDIDRIGHRNDTFMRGLLNALDGIDSKEGVLIIATSNNPEKIDPALIDRPSRFDLVLPFDDPNEKLRQAYVERRIAAEAKLSADQILDLAHKTSGFTMAMLQELRTGAMLNSVRDKKSMTYEALLASLHNLNKSKDRARKATGRRAKEMPGFTSPA